MLLFGFWFLRSKFWDLFHSERREESIEMFFFFHFLSTITNYLAHFLFYPTIWNSWKICICSTNGQFWRNTMKLKKKKKYRIKRNFPLSNHVYVVSSQIFKHTSLCRINKNRSEQCYLAFSLWRRYMAKNSSFAWSPPNAVSKNNKNKMK